MNRLALVVLSLLPVGPLAAAPVFTPAAKPAPLKKLSNSARTQFGYITVPENRTNPGNGKTVKLAVIIAPAKSASPEADPVFYVVGGPGGSATLSSRGFGIFDVLNETRDVVYLDPRGAGFSEPNLYMRRDGFTIGAFVNANRIFFTNNLGVDLSAYNTTEIAQDYEDARIALGYTQINLFANSYGTFVAQEMLRRFPSSLRAVVMTGNSPAPDPFLPTWVKIENGGLDGLFRDVARTRLAREAFPRFKQRFYALVRRLNAKPIRLSLRNTDTGKFETVVIDGDELIGTVTEMLQVTVTLRDIPLMIAELDGKGDGPLVRSYFAPDSETLRDNPFGMYLSVLGTDFAAPGYLNATLRGLDAVPNATLVKTRGPGIYQLSQLVVAWGVPYNPGTTRTLPTSTVPTLLLNGRMDAQTPVSGGAEIARQLTSAVNFVYPRIGHGVGFLRGPDQAAAAAFIRNPTVRPTYSTAGLTAPNFYTRRATLSRLRETENWRHDLPAPLPPSLPSHLRPSRPFLRSASTP